MTDDTLRARAAIAPMADALGIRVEFPDDRAIMICDGQIIRIGGNSTWATIIEFVAYVFLTQYVRYCPSRVDFSAKVKFVISQGIKRYWTEDA